MTRLDITGQKFGMLTALKFVGCEPFGGALWKWRCDCGRTKVIPGYDVRRGHTTSCGCMWRRITAQKLLKDLTGKKFGKLTVLCKSHRRPDGKSSSGQVKLAWYWKCKCDCGSVKTYRGSALTTKNSTSCGCTIRKITKKMAPQIIRLYRSGKGSETLGKQFGVHPNTILKFLRTRGVKIRKP